MNRRIAICLAGACLFAACACGCSEDISDKPDDITVTQASQETAETTSQPTTTTTTATTTTTTTTTSETTTTTTTTTQQTTTTTTTTTAAQTSRTAAPKNTEANDSKQSAAATKATTKQSAAPVERITGNSPNVEFYKQRVFVMGDSVASGYAAYGKIPYDNSVAKVNVSIRSAAYQIPLAKAKNPSLVLTSMGMNDWGISTDMFVNSYKGFLQNLRAALPKSVILVGAITPTAFYNQYPHVSPAVVKSHNAALKHLVETMGDDKMFFFDAYSVVVSSDGVHMEAKYAAGDGLHLQPGAYDALLKAMAVVLDKNGGKEKITANESGKA